MKTQAQISKDFDERYSQYNPVNDTGSHLPIWNGCDYADMKDFISKIRQADIDSLIDWVGKNYEYVSEGNVFILYPDDVINYLKLLKENI